MTTNTIPYRPALDSAGRPIQANTLEWLRWRHGGLGASDGPGWLGLSPYSSPRDVWLSKVSDTITDEQTEAMEFGHVLEPVILAQIAKRHGDPENERHPYLGQIISGGAFESIVYPHLLASFDGLVLEPDADDAVPLQIKNVSPYKSKDWDDAELGVPDEVALQVYHECIVRGVDHGYAAPFFGNRLPEPIRLDLPTEFAEWYVDASATWFQEHVVEGREPAPTLLDDLASVWQAVPGSSVDLSTEGLEALVLANQQRAQIDELTELFEANVLRVKTEMGEHTEAFDRLSNPTKPRLVATWRPHKQAKEKFYRDELLRDHPEVADLLAAYTRRDGSIPRPFLRK